MAGALRRRDSFGGLSEPNEVERALGVPSRRRGAPCSSWVQFGLELNSLGLTAEEEAALEAQSASALKVARMFIAAEEYRLAAVAAGIPLDEESKPDPRTKPRLGTPQQWLDWGKELYALGLSPEEEEGLDAHSKAALGVVRVLAKRGEDTVLPTSATAWVDFGLELSGLELSVEEEGMLDALSRAALAACRVLEVRWMDDETQSKRGINTSTWIELGTQLSALPRVGHGEQRR